MIAAVAVASTIATVVLLPFSLALATTIVILRPDNMNVYVGADSMRSIRGFSGDIRRRELVCKIRRIHSIYVAASGFADYPETKFLLSDLLDRAVSMGRSVSTAAKALEDIAKTPIAALAAHLRNNHPKFSEWYLNSYFVQVALIGIENDAPTVVLRSWMPKIKRGRLDVSVARCSDCQPVILMGEYKAIMQQRVRDGRVILDGAPSDLLRELIGLQIAALPDRVGPPVSILRVHASGTDWINRGTCAN